MVLVEAGHRCAIPTCRQVPVDVHHIVPVASGGNDEFENLIALCRNCHGMEQDGKIDRPAMKMHKANLGLLTGRYSDLERRVLETFSADPVAGTRIALPGGLDLLLKYLVDDGLIRHRPIEGFGHISIGGRPAMAVQAEYELTVDGANFVSRWRGGEDLAD